MSEALAVPKSFMRCPWGKGPDSKHAKVVFSHLDEVPAMSYYHRHQPVRPGVVLAVWRPDGTLIAFVSGAAV
jgi:hypothetical protein